MSNNVVHSYQERVFASKLNKLVGVAALMMGLYTPLANAYVYTCGENEPECVKNYNKHVISNGGVAKKYNVVRVVMPGKSTPSMSNIKSNARWLGTFFNKSSQGQLQVKLGKAITKEVSVGSCKKAKAQANANNRSESLYTIRVFPKGLCGSSNAGRGNANLKSTLKRNFAHEVGPASLGLSHKVVIKRHNRPASTPRTPTSPVMRVTLIERRAERAGNILRNKAHSGISSL